MVIRFAGLMFAVRLCDFGHSVGVAWGRSGYRNARQFRLPFSLRWKWWRYELRQRGWL